MDQNGEAPNSFAILCSILNENTLTECLRYLLDSGESHHLGTQFFLAFLDLLPAKYRVKNQAVVSATSQWRTDKGRKIDIVVVSKDSCSNPPSLAIGIEAKTFSREGDKQISDYQIGLSDAFPNTLRLVVYLTPAGVPANTGNKRYKTCKVFELSWRKIAEICEQSFYSYKFCLEFADHIRNNLPIETHTKDVNPFFPHSVLPEIQRRLNMNDSELTISWSYPNEYNFSHQEINSLFNDERLGVFYMFYSPDGVPEIGKQIHLLVMSHPLKEYTYRLKKDKTYLKELRDKLPPREGGIYEWGKWTFLWSAGCLTLTDMAQKDIQALSSLYVGAYSRTGERLKKEIKKLWS